MYICIYVCMCIYIYIYEYRMAAAAAWRARPARRRPPRVAAGPRGGNTYT